MAVILITHDLGVIAARANRVMVMYAGKIVEGADTDELFAAMRHPYSEALFRSIPRLDHDRSQALYSIPGIPPDLSAGARGVPVRAALPLRAPSAAAVEEPLLAPETSDGARPGAASSTPRRRPARRDPRRRARLRLLPPGEARATRIAPRRDRHRARAGRARRRAGRERDVLLADRPPGEGVPGDRRARSSSGRSAP